MNTRKTAATARAQNTGTIDQKPATPPITAAHMQNEPAAILADRTRTDSTVPDPVSVGDVTARGLAARIIAPPATAAST